MEIERCAMAAVGLALMLILAVGTVGYAYIPSVLSKPAATSALRSADHIDDRNREPDSDRLVTPMAVALGLIALFSVVIAADLS